ncbi:hypothetical protein FCH28_17845 [Streptomyces piniterrae]|uniref:Serine/arginine repetitive matrix protein 2 n=1 Tax=Streptomyces piniterrae TaxID=2571125 RepID=A0A4U0NG31_9ACTN|nr:hypothetical protein [Streptomyces piniterrae]TJZ53020.1 hypothetical protein FCH28_17845 [Streptomyces piniterrae]
MANDGGARWNSETQTWEDGAPRPAPYTGPMPPRPTFDPASAAPPSAAPGFPPPDAAPYADPHAGPGPGIFPGDAPGVSPAPEPVPSGRRRTTALVAGAAVAAIAVGFGGGYLLLDHLNEDPAAARPPAGASAPKSTSAKSGTPTTSSGPPTSQTPTSSPSPQIPDGYHLVHDDKGFTTVLPEGWKRDVRKTGVFYTSPDDSGLVQIFEITEPDYTPRQALEEASKGLAGQPGYEEISLEPLSDPDMGPDATQLVYAYDSDSLGVRVKVVDCAFTTADGHQFAVLVRGPETDWPQQQETQRIALEAFAPTETP